MADFIELNEIYVTSDGWTKSNPKTFNKNLITDIQEDRAHDQTFITYDGKEIAVKETLQEINSKSAE